MAVARAHGGGTRGRRAPAVVAMAAAGGAACAAVTATLIISLLPGSPSAPARGHGSRPASAPAVRHLLLGQLHTGDCLAGPDLGLGTERPWPTRTTAVPCNQHHLAEVFFADSAYWPGPYPGGDTITRAADAQCDKMFTAYVGVPDPSSIYTWDNIFPDATDWRHGERELVCLAYHPASSPPGGVPITGSVKRSGR